MSKLLNEINLLELLPPNLAADANVAACANALNAELKAVSNLVTAPMLYARLNELTGAQLDHLAWQFDSKTWRDTWPLHIKRSVIKTVIIEKAKKGTRFAVEKSVQSFGSAVEITEWFENGAPPHTFGVLASLAEISGFSPTEVRAALENFIDESKPVRAKYEITLAAQINVALGMLAVARPVVFTRLSGL